MDFNKFAELFPKAGFVKIAPFNEEELYDETVRIKNKAPLNSLKDPLNVAQARNWLSRGGRLGWVVPKNYIVIDIDNKDHAKSSQVTTKILKNHSINYWHNTSKNGSHYIFKNTLEIMKNKGQFQGMLNHIGIQADGRADGKGYIILPTNDEVNGRKWENWNAEGIDELPFWLRPLRSMKDSDVSFIDMPDGMGNEALFKLRGAHTGPNLITEEESIECLRIINWEIWESPMSEATFEATVARPVEKTYGNMKAIDGTGVNKTKSFLPVAKRLIAEHNLIAVGDFIYQYKNGIYDKLTTHELHAFIHEHGDPEATKSQRREIIDFICVQKQVPPYLLDKEYTCIPTQNGYLDLMNLELVAASPEQYNTVKVDIPFDPECVYSERIDDMMKFVSGGDQKIMDQLYEIAGYCLLRRNNFHKFFLIVGGGGTGKSTYTGLIRKMFKSKYVSKVALSQFDQDYHLSTLVGAMVNIDDDASNEKLLKDAGRFKSATAGMPILVRPIYSEPVELECMATVIVCANGMPKIQDDSEGLFRRMLIVELNNRIKNPDRNFDNTITDLDMTYFFYKSCVAINRVLRNGRFTLEQSEDALKQKFKVQQSSINKWCQLEYIQVQALIGRGLKSIYQDYKAWCTECGYGPFNYGNFVDAIIKQYKIITSYDTGTRDQMVTSSLLPNDYCPFEQSLQSSYE